TPAWVTTHWTRLTSTERQLPLTTQAGLIAPHTLGQPTPVVPGGAKKKKNKTAQADQNTASTSQNPPHETAPAVSESLKQEIRTITLALPSPPRDPERLIDQVADMITRHPQPKEIPLSTVISTVHQIQSGPQPHHVLVAHPPVLYAAMHRRYLTDNPDYDDISHSLSPHLVELLSKAPSLLDWLVEVPAGFYTTDPAALVEALLRPGTIERLDSDPQLRSLLRSTALAPGLLARLRGRMDVVEAVLSVHGPDPLSTALGSLIQVSPTFASALLEREDAAETVWRIGADLTLVSALFNVAWRLPGSLTVEFSRELLDRPEEWSVFSLLRAHPSTATLLMASAEVRSAATERPDALRALAEAPELVDSLEDNPALAARLLARPEALAAALGALPRVTDTLAVDPNRYDEVPDADLAWTLNETPDLTPPKAREIPAPDLLGPVATARLMQYLRGASPAWNLQLTQSGLGRTILESSLYNDGWNAMLHIAAWYPAAATPNGIRRAFTQRIGHNLVPPRSPDNYAMWPLMEFTYRHQLGRVLHQLKAETVREAAKILATYREGYLRVYHSPANAVHFTTTGIVPSQNEARWNSHVPAAAALHLRFRYNSFDDVGMENTEGFAVGNAALLRLVHRHPVILRSFGIDKLQPILSKIKENPQLLQSLMPSYGSLSAGLWMALLSHGWLYERMAQHMGEPLVQALIAHPELLSSALSRSDFPEAWDRDRSRFNSLAEGPYEGLAAAIAATGERTVTDDGQVLEAKTAKLAHAAHAALLAREPVGALTQTMRELQIEPAHMAEISGGYETVLNDEALRVAATLNATMTSNLISNETFVDLFRKRPTLAEHIRRRPQLGYAVVASPELRQLLTENDHHFQAFTGYSTNYHTHYTNEASRVSLSVPSYLLAAHSLGPASHAMSNIDSVFELMKSSEAISQFIANHPRAVLDQLHQSLTEVMLQVGGEGERSEDVFRAVMAGIGRLQAISESPYLLLNLAEYPGVAKYLGDHPEVLSGPGQWQAVLDSSDLLGALERRPEVVPLVLEAGVVELALGSPGLVEVLYRAPVGVRRAMVTGWRGDLLREQPGLVARLVTDEDWPVVFLWLPEGLRRQPGVLREFLETPGLVSVVRRTRVLVRTL
ncbi:hypothetical protein ACWDYK_39035, partial [Streptomyces anthocyanicus]